MFQSMAESTQPPATGSGRLVRNYAILTGGEFLAKILGIASFAYLARVLGPQVYGTLELAIAITFWFSMLVDSGLSTYGAREIARNRASVACYATHVMAIKLLLSVTALAALVILVGAIDRSPETKRIILLYGMTLLAMPAVLPWVFQGLDQMHAVAIASIIRWLLFAGGVFLLVRGPAQAWLAPVVDGISLLAMAAFYMRGLGLRGGLARQRLSPALAWSMLRQAWFIGASELVWAVKLFAATVLIGVLFDGAPLGFYGAANRVVISLHTFVWLYFFNLLPSLSRCANESREDPRDHSPLLILTGRSMRATAWLAVPVGIIGSTLAGPLVALVYGQAYGQTADVLRVLIWYLPLTLLNGHYRYTLIAHGQQKLELLAEVCAVVLNLALILLLMPIYGLVAAAWSLVASEMLLSVLAYAFTWRAVARIPFWRHLTRPIAAGAVLIVALFLLRSINIWAMSSLAVMVYGISCVAIQPGLLPGVHALFVRDVP